MRQDPHSQGHFQLIHRGLLVFYYALTLFALFHVISAGQYYLIAMSVAALLLPLVPKALYRVCKLRPVYLFEIIFNGFAMVAVPFASVLGGYDIVPYLDKILHCASGFLFAVAGMLAFYYLKPGRKVERTDAPLAATFSAMTAMSSAVLWEIYEYILSLFGPDPQLVALTGVHDTMQDMLVCTIGGLLTARACFRYLRGGRRGLMMRLFESFYEINMKPAA